MSYIGSPTPPVIANVSDDSITPAKLSPGHPNWDSSENVGIGTSSPSTTHRLTLDKPTNYGGIEFKQAGTRVGQIIQDGIGNLFVDANSNNGGGSLHLRNYYSDSLVIDPSGYVTKPNQPAFYARGTGTQSWSGTSSYQTLQLSTQETLGSRSTGYNTSTYAFTAPIAGTYVFFGRMTQTTTVTGPAMFLLVNGVTAAQEMSIGYSTAYMTNGGFRLIQLAANDEVKLAVNNYNNTSLTLDLTRSAFAGWLFG
jgi:hypothetical protein